MTVRASSPPDPASSAPQPPASLSAPPVALPLPRAYNAAAHFIDRHLEEGRGGKVALVDDAGETTYAALAERVNRAGNALKALGVDIEQRVLLCMLDSADFVAAFWGALKLGAVAVPVNTLLTTGDYAHMLRDSRARVAIVSAPLYPKVQSALGDLPFLRVVVVAGAAPGALPPGTLALEALLDAASTELPAAPTTPDDVAFWLYSSGSTGAPKGAVHLHQDLVHTAVLYGERILGVREDDVVFSAAKLFFAYGLGNSMTFPFHAGATAILLAERPTPPTVMDVLHLRQPTIFYGVPTLFAAILADPASSRETGSQRLRICASAGEALPREIGERWFRRMGAHILDGLGSTELLHIFLSNRPDDVRYGTTGTPVPGYELRLVDEHEAPVADGEVGELLVKGPTASPYYWNNRARSLATFQGPWTRTGDKYVRDAAGYYTYAGRSDDMIKAGGVWVSPVEVENTLVEHPAVLEAAVVARDDGQGLLKPAAFVVLRDGVVASPDLAAELQLFVKERLAGFKYPRWVEFIPALPKTATGKIQRFKLRQGSP